MNMNIKNLLSTIRLLVWLNLPMLKIRIKYKILFFFKKYKSIDEIYDYINNKNLQRYLVYTEKDSFLSLVDYINFDFKGKEILDIGPGLGRGLLEAKRQGAKTINFVELDPIAFEINSLYGFNGYKYNQFKVKRIKNLNKQDLVYLKGTIEPKFIDQINKSRIINFSFEQWLTDLKGLLNDYGYLVVTPQYNYPHANYKDKDYFHSEMIKHGFERHHSIIGHNRESNLYTYIYKNNNAE